MFLGKASVLADLLACAEVRDCLWNGLLVNPLMEGLRLLFRLTGSWGVAIFLFTLAMKVVLFPLTAQQIRSQKRMQDLQPLLKELQKRYGKDRERMAQEQMRLYKEHKVNPAAGCVPLVVQMPILFALYAALLNLGDGRELSFHQAFLWVSDLSKPDAFDVFGVPLPGAMPLLAGATQWVQTKMAMPHTVDPQQRMQNQMMQFMPLMIIFFGTSFAAGIALYWVVSTVFGIVQQYFTTGWGTLLPEGAAGPGAGLIGRWATRSAGAVRTAAARSDAPGQEEQRRPAGGKPGGSGASGTGGRGERGQREGRRPRGGMPGGTVRHEGRRRSGKR